MSVFDLLGEVESGHGRYARKRLFPIPRDRPIGIERVRLRRVGHLVLMSATRCYDPCTKKGSSN